MKCFWRTCFIGLLVLAGAGLAEAKARHPDRILVAKFSVNHLKTCLACAAKMAKALDGLDGVLKTHAARGQDAAYVFFEAGRVSPEEMVDALQREGFAAHMTWGPAAAKLDGRFEDIPFDEIPQQKPTLKEKEAALGRPRTAAPKSYLPPEKEALPQSND